MRTVIRLAALLSIAAAGAVSAQQDFSQVQIQAHRITDNIHVLTGAGGNIGALVGNDGVLIVDSQFAPLHEKIRAALGQLSKQPVRFLVNTHWHGDHTGGNEAFGRNSVSIVAHNNVRRRLSTQQVGPLNGQPVPPSPAAALPVVTFDQSITFHYNGETIEITHVPNAHTDGDAIIRFRNANTVHLGDLYFNGLYPVIDYTAGGSINGVIAGVDRVLANIDDQTRVIPGHGNPNSNRRELQEYRNMLATVRDRVQELIRAGRTAEQVVAAKPTQEFDAKWGRGLFTPDQWVQRVYSDLSRNR